MNWPTPTLKFIHELSTRDDKSDSKGTLSLRQDWLEFDYFVALGELNAQNNLTHGMEHLAQLLSYDPSWPAGLELLESYLALAPDNPERLLDSETHSGYFAFEAVRAYIFAKIGRLEEALNYLLQIARAKPDVPYLEAWALEWLRPDGVVESLSQEYTFQMVSSGVTRFGEFPTLTYRQQFDVLAYANIAQRVLRCLPSDTDEAIAAALEMGYAGLLRKGGQFSEALVAAERALERYPVWSSAIAAAKAYQAAGRLADAERAFELALSYTPEDITTRIEIADMYFKVGAWENAQRWYQDVLNREADHEWAYPSAIYCQWKRTNDPDAARVLGQLVSGDHPNQRAWELVAEYRPYIGYLPEPSDALANVLRQILQQLEDKDDSQGEKSVRCTVSCLESPSNHLAFKLAGFSATISVSEIPSPDPRQPLEPVPYLLWTYDGTDPSPALAAPTPAVTEAIAAIAPTPLAGGKLWAAASRLAATLREQHAIDAVLAAMVHPPAPPAETSPLQWLPRVQLTAAFVLCHWDTGWVGSQRRDALYSVLLGPRDWTTTAAIVALATLAEDYKAIATDVSDAFLKLHEAMPEIGSCCYDRALYYNWLRLPHLYDNEREDLQRLLAEVEEQEQEETTED